MRKHLWQPITRAIKRFELIQDGDRIGVGLSGGRDSSVLLFALSSLRKRAPVSFEVMGLHVDCGFGIDTRPLEALCSLAEVEFHTVQTPIAKALEARIADTSPCSLCAHLRRGAVNSLAKSLGCNKTALGHHSDDALETLLLCMIYESRIATLKPISYLDRTGITLIRPLILVRRETIERAVSCYGLPWAPNRCPYEGKSKRSTVRAFINHIESIEPGAKARLITSLCNVHVDSLWT
jgi:tRNA 2-thiocytidine biosynthesis protein TtcA